MNTTIALRSLAGAVLIAAVATGCGDEQGVAPAQIPPGAAPVPSQPPLGCRPTADHVHRNDASRTHTTCSPEQRRNDDMQDQLGHM